jgi:hypothetical protein
VRAEEDGKSEGYFVMKWIRIEQKQQNHPTRKRADFHLVFRHKRT